MKNLRPHRIEKLGDNQKGPSFYTQEDTWIALDIYRHRYNDTYHIFKNFK